jgi:hypothetical protein
MHTDSNSIDQFNSALYGAIRSTIAPYRLPSVSPLPIFNEGNMENNLDRFVGCLFGAMEERIAPYGTFFIHQL